MGISCLTPKRTDEGRTMVDITAEMAVYALAAVAVGIGIGWLLQSSLARRRIDKTADHWQSKLDEVALQRDRQIAENGKLRTRVEEQEAAVHRHETAVKKAKAEIDSAAEREKRMSHDIFTLRGEREDFKNKVTMFQNALVSVKQQTVELQNEFINSREFYKGELQKSFEKRKDLETRLDDAKHEHESFNNLLKSTKSEQESVNRMLESARSRLADLDNLEHKAVSLESENAQLIHDARLAQQEIEVLKRDVAELDELKVQNKELAHCLQSMEESRRQYESDAQRYKEFADKTEKKSETLRVRLDEVEKNFLDIEKQQSKALKEARKENSKRPINGHKSPKKESDNLQDIIGIGKVFERTLNDIGIYTFKQIANFGPSDIARVNRELKEFSGRMEQDDWIGQAKQLHFKKYGSMNHN